MSGKKNQELNSSKNRDYQCERCNKELPNVKIYSFGGRKLCHSCMIKIIFPIFSVILGIVLIIILFNIL